MAFIGSFKGNFFAIAFINSSINSTHCNEGKQTKSLKTESNKSKGSTIREYQLWNGIALTHFMILYPP